MNKSELISLLASKNMSLPEKDAAIAAKAIIEQMIKRLEASGRIEIRGFGAFSLKNYKPRNARNPKTGEPVEIGEKSSVHFKPGKMLSKIVNQSKVAGVEIKQSKPEQE